MSGEGTNVHGDSARAHGDWVDLARAAARRAAGRETEDVAPRQFLTFSLADEPYGIPVERVREIVRMRKLTPIPRVPGWMCGVISLRGEIVQVIDLRQRLGLEPAAPNARSRIIVARGDVGHVTGLLVDGVEEVLRVTEDAVRPAAPGDSGCVEELCVRGDEFVSLVDLDRVLETR